MPQGMPADTNVFPIPSKCCIRRVSQDELDYWCPVRTLDWATDNNTGRIYAAALIDDLLKSGKNAIAIAMIRQIVKKGEYGGVEAGFFQALLDRITLASDPQPL